MLNGSSIANLAGLRREEIQRIDSLLPYLGYRHESLTVNDTPASELWSGGHPLLLFLPERVADNYHEINNAFAEHFQVSVRYALKSCYLPDVVQTLRSAGAGVEVMSRFEWAIAHRYGFHPHQIVANGIRREPDFIEELLSAGCGLIGVDCAEELEAVVAAARRLGARPNVAIRANPLAEDPFFGSGSKLGARMDEAAELLQTALGSPCLGNIGLHAHQLRKCVNPEQFGALAGRLADLAEQCAAGSHSVRFLNLGGGFESRYLMERAGASCRDFAEAARDRLRGTSNFRLILEPGRFLVSDAALAFTRVHGEKRTADARWLITDIGTNILTPRADRSYHPLPIALAAAGAPSAWDGFHVSDSIGVPNQLCLDAQLPHTVLDHGLAMLNCGAYSTVYAELWGCELPDIAVADASGFRTVFGASDRERMLTSLYAALDPARSIIEVPR
ncbi:diaminopimelate decarboxylase family protein [Streptomyces sp. NPDC004230]